MNKMKKTLLTLLACSCLAATAGLAVACGDDTTTTPPNTPSDTPGDDLAKIALNLAYDTHYTSTDPVEYEIAVGATKKWMFSARPHATANAAGSEHTQDSQAAAQADDAVAAEFTCAIDFGAGYTSENTITVNAAWFASTRGSITLPEIPATTTKVKVKVTPKYANTYLATAISEVYDFTATTTTATVAASYPAGNTAAMFCVRSTQDGTFTFGGTVTSGDVKIMGEHAGEYYATTQAGNIVSGDTFEVEDNQLTVVQLILDPASATQFSMNLTYTPTPAPVPVPVKAYTLGLINTDEYEKTVEYDIEVGNSNTWIFEANPMTAEHETTAEFDVAFGFGEGYGASRTVNAQNGYFIVTVPANAARASLKVIPKAENTTLNFTISEVYDFTAVTTATINASYPVGTQSAKFYVSAEASGSVAFGGTVEIGSVTFGGMMATYATTSEGAIVPDPMASLEIVGGDEPTAVQVILDSASPTQFSATLTFTETQEEEGGEIVFYEGRGEEAPYTLGTSKEMTDTYNGLSLMFKKSGTYTITVTCSTADGMTDGIYVATNFEENVIDGTIDGVTGVFVVTVDANTNCIIYPNNAPAGATYSIVITKA